jgi:cytosine/adenosine deaminase-related metal-dependent hydrolase
LYRKFSADHLFTGHQLLSGDHVLITGADGTILDIVDKAAAGDDVQQFNGILSPGFINCHCHIELSHMKSIVPKHTGLVDFVQQVMGQRNDFTEEEKQQAMVAAEQEMYDSGIVAVGDICNATDSVSLKQKSKLCWHNFIEVSGFVDAVAAKRFDAAQEIAAQFRQQLPQFKTTLSPHAPYSVSKTLFELLNAATANELITIHNQESREEDKLYFDKTGDFLKLYKNFGIDISSFTPTGKSSLQSWLPYFNKKQSILLVHDTFTKQEDLDLIKLLTISYQPSTVLCPNANRYIENQLPPIELLVKNNCNIAVGTDSYASNDQLMIIEELKTLQQHFPSLELTTLLQWATINGAKALQMDDQLGNFEKGKKPGVVVIENVEAMQLQKNTLSKRVL